MFFNSEIDFISEFVASLKKKGVQSIPFDTTDFYEGVAEMDHYFQLHREELGDVSYEIAMLFVKNPFENVYNRFREAISAINDGKKMSFDNPEYVTGTLKLSEKSADYILKKNRSGIRVDFTKECATKFCDGANINIRA